LRGSAVRRKLEATYFRLNGHDLVTADHVPKGYSSITLYFTVDDSGRLIEFLTTAFDASLIRESRYENGRLQHARIQIGTSIIMLNEASETYPANISQMHLFVEDTDATYEAALKSGASSLMKPNDRPHGDRMAGITDPCGNIW